MPRIASLLLALVAALCALAPAAASAQTLAAEPLATGGLVTNEGSATSSYRLDTPYGLEDEKLTARWKTVGLVTGAYPGLSVAETHVPGAGTSGVTDEHEPHPISGHTDGAYPQSGTPVWKEYSCDFRSDVLSLPRASGVDGLSRTVRVEGVGEQRFGLPDSKCSDRSGGASPTTSGVIRTMSNAELALGDEPRASLSQSYTSQPPSPGVCAGRDGCTTSTQAQGTLTLSCAACVESLTFEQRDVATGAWELPSRHGITDGNRVRVTARVRNASKHTLRVSPALVDRTRRSAVRDAAYHADVDIPAGRTAEVVIEWDTTGAAWDGAKPVQTHDLVFDTGMGAGRVSLDIRPRPVVLVHGWKATAAGWADAKQILPQQVHPGLAFERTFAVGDGRFPGRMDTNPFMGNELLDNATEEAKYVQALREELDAEHVDLVVHSMGGLISRAYVQHLMPMGRDGKPAVRQVAMLGTPNMGSPCATLMVAAGVRGFPTLELTPAFVDGLYNKRVTQTKGVRFGVLAGNYLPTTCGSGDAGDGVVAVPSAYWTLADATTWPGVHHVEMTDIPAIYAGWVKYRLGAAPPAPTRVASRATARAAGAEAAPGAVLPGGTVDVPAGGSADVPVEVADGTRLVAAVLADADVSATLVDPSGAERDTIAAGTPEAAGPVRSLVADAPAAGRWTVRLRSAGAAASKAAVGFELAGSATALQVERGDGLLWARATQGGQGIAGATVTARLTGADGADLGEVALHDDGAHGDGAAGDGTYATSELPAGDWVATVTSASARGTRTALTSSGGAAVPVPADGGPVDPGPTPTTPTSPTDAPTPTGTTDVPAPTTSTPPPPARVQPLVPAVPAGPAPVPPPPPAAAAARKLTLRVTAARDRRAPYRFSLAGTASGCRAGTEVRIVVRAGRRTVGRATARTTARCAYRATVRVRGRGKLRATATTSGAPAAALALRAG